MAVNILWSYSTLRVLTTAVYQQSWQHSPGTTPWLPVTMWETLRVAPRDLMTPESLSLKEVWLGTRHLLCLEHHSFTASLMSPSVISAEIEFTAPENTTVELVCLLVEIL